MVKAFNGGIKRPQIRTQGEGTGQKQRPYDRLVTVLGYNLDAKKLTAEDEKGKKYEVFINLEQYMAGEASAQKSAVDRSTTWMGHSIDKQMEKNYGVGKKLILKKTIVLKKDNGKGFAETEAERIVGVPNSEPDKTFQGIFTLTAYKDKDGFERIGRVQHWKNNSIDVNDEEGLKALKLEMDKANENSNVKIGEYNVTLPTIGVQFIASMKTDKIYELDGSNKPIYEAVNSSIPFDWIELENVKGHTITGDEMMGYVNDYIEYISSHPSFAEHLDNMKIEVATYRSYPASNNDFLKLTYGQEHRDIHKEKNPLYALSHAKTYVDTDQTEMIIGRNFAVNGIVQISPNKLAKVNGKAEEIPSFWINNLHANGTTGHVLSFIRTSDGSKVEVHEKLKRILDNKPAQAQNSTPAQAQAPAPAPAPASAAQVPAATSKEEEEFDPFKITGDEEQKPVRFGNKK